MSQTLPCYFFREYIKDAEVPVRSSALHAYLTANDGANFIVRRGGGPRYIWVAVAEAP